MHEQNIVRLPMPAKSSALQIVRFNLLFEANQFNLIVLGKLFKQKTITRGVSWTAIECADFCAL